MTWMVEHNVGKIAQYAVRVGRFLNQKIRKRLLWRVLVS